MGLFEFMLNGMGFENNNRTISRMAKPNKKPNNNAFNNYQTFNLHEKNKKQTVNKIDTNTSNLIVYAPSNHEEVQKVIDCIKKDQACLCNFYNIEQNSKSRVLDFLSGGIYALEGQVSRIQGDLFLLTPKGINIKTTT